jgi:hypothetical protein
VPFETFPQVKRLRLQFQLARLDFGEVEDVVDDGEQRLAAVTNSLGKSRCSEVRSASTTGTILMMAL